MTYSVTHWVTLVFTFGFGCVVKKKCIRNNSHWERVEMNAIVTGAKKHTRPQTRHARRPLSFKWRTTLLKDGLHPWFQSVQSRLIGQARSCPIAPHPMTFGWLCWETILIVCLVKIQNLQSVGELTERGNDYQQPLCVGFVDFDTVSHNTGSTGCGAVGCNI